MIDPLPDQSLVHKSAAFAWLRSAWDWLGQSYASGVEKDRVKSRLMSYLLIFMVLFLSLVFPILLYFDPLLPAGPMSIGFGVTIAVFCAAYAISRTKYAFLAASMTVLISAVSAWMLTYALARDANKLPYGLIFVIISIILSSLLLSGRFTAILGIIHLAAIALLPLQIAGLFGSLQWMTLLIFVALVSALITLYTVIREYDQREIERQSDALSRSEKRFRLLSFATNDVVWDWDVITDRKEHSQSLFRLFGYDPDQANLDFGWWQANIHPDDRAKIVESIRAALDGGGEFWSKEYRFCQADGSYAHVFDRGYVTRDETGKPVRMLGAMMDITRWRKAEEELATERNLLRTLIDILPDEVYVKDTQSRFLLCNPAVAHSKGVADPADLLGRTDYDFYPPEMAAQFFADEQTLLQTGRPLPDREDFHVDEATGKTTWGLTSKILLRDSRGEIVGLVGVGRDITMQKLHEEALQNTNQVQTAWIDELEQRKHEITLLNRTADLLQTCATVEEAFPIIGRQAGLLFPTEAGALYIINTLRSHAELAAVWGPALPDPTRFDPDDCWALGQVEMYQVDHSANDAKHPLCRHIQPPMQASYICMPLFAQGAVEGLLHLRGLADQDPASPPQFPETKQQLIRRFAQTISLALVNLKLRDTLRQQSIRDQLTGMFNRRYMEESLEREIRRATRAQTPLGLIMLDIDHFKQFNDSFGHEAGDAVLRELGIFLRSHVREADIACRLGGEEFVLILPDASLRITRRRANDLRLGVRKLRLVFNQQVLDNVTISFGIAMYPEHGSSGGVLLRAADAALYRAKETGRNRVLVAKRG